MFLRKRHRLFIKWILRRRGCFESCLFNIIDDPVLTFLPVIFRFYALQGQAVKPWSFIICIFPIFSIFARFFEAFVFQFDSSLACY
jgi:hypothetical protein